MADSIKSVDVPSVHGMVALNPDGTAIGTPVGGATSANQTNGSQKTQIVDAGGDAVTVTGGKLDVNASIDTTGLATSAKQDTIIGHVDGIETSLSSIDGKITAVNTGAVVVSSSALPSGASTAAKQPALGTAGTASADVITVQGIASMTALKVDGSAVTQPVSGTVAVTNAGLTALNGAISGTEVQVDVVTMPGIAGDVASGSADSGNPVKVGGVYEASLPTYADGQRTRWQSDTRGQQRVVLGLANSTTLMQTAADNADDVAASATARNLTVVGRNTVFDGTTWDRMYGDSTNGVLVNLGSNNDVSLNAGTNAVGKLLPPDIDITAHTNYAKKYYTNAGAVTDGIIWSPAAGKRWYVVSIIINTSAATTVTLEDDKSGGDEVVLKLDLAANSGIAYNFTEHYPLASGEDAADLLVTTSAGNIYITCVGYEI